MVRYEPIEILSQPNPYSTLKERYPMLNLLIVAEPSNFKLLPRNSGDKEIWYAQFTIYELDSSDPNFETKARTLIDHSPTKWLIISSPLCEKSKSLCAKYNIDITQCHYSYFGV